MATERLPVAVWEGTFTLFGVTLHCATLDTGQRVIEADDIVALFDAMGADGAVSNDGSEAAIQQFGLWLHGSGVRDGE